MKDVVTETLAGGLTEIRMSEPILDAVLALRSFLFDAVYENTDRDRRVQEGGRRS